jgi:hypothetical protein
MVDLEIHDLEGIGPTTARKLKGVGGIETQAVTGRDIQHRCRYNQQVQSSPDTFFGDPTKAAGGNILGHSSTYRIYLRKSGENRVAKMMDSPYHPYSEVYS